MFILENCIVDRIEFLWQWEKHLKFILEEASFSIIWFWLWEFREKLLKAKKLSFIWTLSRNVWMWNISVQFMVNDILLN